MNATYLRFPGGKSKVLTLSYDDGVEQDIRMIELLNKHGIKCTFNINGGVFAPEGTVYEQGKVHRRMTKKQCYELYAESGHEVAIHAYTHPHLESLPASMVAMEIFEDRKCLEETFGRVIRGMAYPYGTYNDTVVEVLKNSGVAYARTTVSTEKFGMPTDWLRLPATCHHNNKRLMEFAEKFVGMEVSANPQMFYLWGHTYEFEGNDNWSVIEEFCEYIGGKDDIWYATNIEIYDYVQAYNRLEWAADASRVHNPSAMSVWVKAGKHQSKSRIVEIKPGETVKLF